MLDLFIGRRELGKTTLAVHTSRFFDTRVFFDPRHMINTTSDILTDGQVSGVLYDLLDTRAEIVIQPHFQKEETFAEMCAEICAWLKDNPGEKFCLLFDECRFIKAPEENEHFDWIVRCTPREQVSVIMTCHGVVDVSPDLRRVADYWVLFHLTMEADVDRVRERCGEEIAEEVQKLAPYEYIVYNDAVNGAWRKHTDRAKWFTPLEIRTVSV